MGLAKYSPTVSRSYSDNQEWFEKNGGNFSNGLLYLSFADNQGYDAYGYSYYNDRDRAGYTEDDYLCDSIDNGGDGSPLYNRVQDQWYYSNATILDLNQSLQAKIEQDPLFRKKHADFVAVVEIIESIGDAKYKLSQQHKALGASGDVTEFNRLSAVLDTLLVEAKTAFDKLQLIFETFYEDTLQKIKTVA